jgi:predicted metal-dependent hydrolase
VTVAVGSASIPEPALAPEDLEALGRGIARFNDGLFFECHDTLEEVWAGVRGPSREFFQGLIQASVGFYHLGNGNRPGAATLLRRALARLERYPGCYAGVDLARLRASLGEWLAALESGSPWPSAAPPRIEAAEEAR